MKRARANSKTRNSENEKKKEAMRKLRIDEEHRVAENEKKKEEMRKLRSHEEQRVVENVKNKEAMRKLRINEEHRVAENEKKKEEMRKLRSHEEHRVVENVKNKVAMRKLRIDEQHRKEENQLKRLVHSRKQLDFENLLREYKSQIREGPTFVCSSCGGLWYRASVHKADKERFGNNGCDENFINTIFNCTGNGQDGDFFCGTCWKSVNRPTPKIPKLCLSNGFEFPKIPPQLIGLTALEERLVALRLPFVQIRSLGADRQFGMQGNIVNVINDLDTSAKVSLIIILNLFVNMILSLYLTRFFHGNLTNPRLYKLC
jgi:hypothetical protein